MVYNRGHPTEQYRISLKLTAGALRTFFLSPGSKNAHAFWTLEEKITAFLKVGRGAVVHLLPYKFSRTSLFLGD